VEDRRKIQLSLRSIRPFFRRHRRLGVHLRAVADITDNVYNEDCRTYLVYVGSNRAEREGLGDLQQEQDNDLGNRKRCLLSWSIFISQKRRFFLRLGSSALGLLGGHWSSDETLCQHDGIYR
jgi:hypothetical protein